VGTHRFVVYLWSWVGGFLEPSGIRDRGIVRTDRTAVYSCRQYDGDERSSSIEARLWCDHSTEFAGQVPCSSHSRPQSVRQSFNIRKNVQLSSSPTTANLR
jgi:hypothetical protein